MNKPYNRTSRGRPSKLLTLHNRAAYTILGNHSEEEKKSIVESRLQAGWTCEQNTITGIFHIWKQPNKNRVTKEIDVNLIDMDRIPLDRKVVRFTYAIQAMAVFPAIKVAKLSNGRFKILDGRHRWTAHKLLGKEKILVRFSTKLLRDMKEVKRKEQLKLDILDQRPEWEGLL